MKVYFDISKTRFPKGGSNDSIVYCYHNDGNVCIGRKYYKVPYLVQHGHIIKMEKIALEIWRNLPLRVKKDFLIYAKGYIEEYPRIRRKFSNSYGIFLKVIHKIESEFHISERQDAGFDLYKKLFGIFSVYDFIRLGFLLPIKFAYKLTAKIFSDLRGRDNIYRITVFEDTDLFTDLIGKRAYG